MNAPRSAIAYYRNGKTIIAIINTKAGQIKASGQSKRQALQKLRAALYTQVFNPSL